MEAVFKDVADMVLVNAGWYHIALVLSSMTETRSGLRFGLWLSSVCAVQLLGRVVTFGTIIENFKV